MKGTALERAAALLAREGCHDVRVEALGHEQEVLAVTAPAAARTRLAELAPRLRELGFRYVALDIGATPTEDLPFESGVS